MIGYVFDRLIPAIGVAACLVAIWLVMARKNRSLVKEKERRGFSIEPSVAPIAAPDAEKPKESDQDSARC